MPDLQRHLASVLVAFAVSGSAGPALAQSAPIVQPGAPGKPSRVITPEVAARLRPGVSAADVIADSAFGCAGQRCLATSLAITVGGVHDSFVDAIRDRAQNYATEGCNRSYYQCAVPGA